MRTNELKKLIKEVLDKGYLMSLATVDDGGVWVSDVIYVHDDNFNIFWMSNTETRHSKALMENLEIAGTITISGQGEKNLGIQFKGRGYKIEGARYDLAIKHFTKRKKAIPKETDDVLEGDSWYMMQPKSIELICEEFFGFDRQTLNP